MKTFIRTFILSLVLSVSTAFGAAAGDWNGVAFSAWNGVSISAWNGTTISTTGGGGGGGGGTGLLTSLSAHYKMDEASGNRADSTANGFTLIDNNTVTSNTGLLNSAAEFTEANTERLNITDNSTFSSADASFSIAGWFKTGSLTGGAGVWAVCFKGTAYGVYSDGTVLKFQTAGSDLQISGNLSASTWYFFSATYEGGTKAKTLRFGTTSSLGSRFTGTSSSATSDDSGSFNIGGYGATGTSFPWTGLIDEFAFWKGRVLSTGDEVLLYNSGSPLPYASW